MRVILFPARNFLMNYVCGHRSHPFHIPHFFSSFLPFRPPSFFFLSSLLAPAPSCCPRGFSYDFDYDEDELNRLRSWLLTLMATQAKQAVKDAEAAEAEEQKRFDERMGVLQRKTAEAKVQALRVANVLSMSSMAIEETETAFRRDMQEDNDVSGGGAAGSGAAGGGASDNGAAGGGGGDGGGAGQGNDAAADDDDDDDDDEDDTGDGMWVD